MLKTFPSAQSFIACSGNLARYIVVVLYHIGSPRKRTVAQNEKITARLVHIECADSGGGTFFTFSTQSACDGNSAASSVDIDVVDTTVYLTLAAEGVVRGSRRS